MTIADVSKNANGQVVIRLQLQTPTDSVPAGGAANPFAPPPIIKFRPAPVPAPPAPGGAAAPPAAGGGVAVGGIAIAPGGAAIVIGRGGWNGHGAAGLSLLDDKGNVIKQVGSQMQFQTTDINGVVTTTQMQVLTFQPEKDQEPSKLVYSARKVLSVDVPFTLKDVPLP